MCTVDNELSGFGDPTTGDIPSDTTVVGRVAESHLADDQITFVRDDQIHVAVRFHWLAVSQPKNLIARNVVKNRTKSY